MRLLARAMAGGIFLALAPISVLAADGSIPVDPLRAAALPALHAVSDDEPTALDEIVVTGTRTAHRFDDSPVEVQLIDSAEIRRSGARDVAELLQREGGVTVTPVAGRGNSIEIQGLSSEQVLILVDGRRMIGRINGAIDLARLRLESVERIEIVKGPSSALYGADALGGVVNIITRRGRGESTAAITARVDTGTNAELSGYNEFATQNWRGGASGGLQRLQPYDLDASSPGSDGIDGDSRYLTVDSVWQASPEAEIGLHGAYSLDDALRTDGSNGRAVFDTRKRIEEIRAGIAPRLQLGAQTALSLDTYYNRYYDQYLQTQQGNADELTYEQTLNQLYAAGGQLDHALGEHQLSVGGEYQLEQLEADRLSADSERDRQSLYLQDQWRPQRWADLTLIPGLRYDRDSQFGSQVSPKLALRVDLADGLFLRAGYGRGYRAPDFKQLLLRFDNPAIGYRVEGNPDLQPERGTGFNAGLVWLGDDKLGVSLTLFRNRVNGLIDIVLTDPGPPAIYSYRNVESALLQGFDLQAQLRPLPALQLDLGYGFLDATDRQSGERLSGRARNRVNVAARWQAPVATPLALSLRGVWTGERVFGVELDSGGAPLPAGTADAYTLLDARADWQRWQQLDLAVGIKNLLDAGDPRYLPIAPRAAYLELKWSLR